MKLVFYIFLMLPLSLISQSNNLNIELLGKSLIGINVSYEHDIKNNFIVGGTVGYHYFFEVIPIEGEFRFRPPSCLGLYGGYRLNNKKKNTPKNFLLLNAGAFALFYEDLVPFVNIAYERKPKRNFFRFNTYIMFNDDLGYSSVLPWVGLSFGRTFK